MQSFFEDCSISTGEDIESLDLEERNELFSVVSEMLLTAFMKVRALHADCNSSNATATTRIPVVLPHHMYAMRPREFYDVVKMHKERLSVTHNAE